MQGSLCKGWVPHMGTTKLSPAVFICAVAAPKGRESLSLADRISIYLKIKSLVSR